MSRYVVHVTYAPPEGEPLPRHARAGRDRLTLLESGGLLAVSGKVSADSADGALQVATEMVDGELRRAGRRPVAPVSAQADRARMVAGLLGRR